MFLRLFLSLILLCGTGLSLAQMDETVKTRQKARTNHASTQIANKVKHSFPNAEVEETIAKWKIDGYHILMLSNPNSVDGIIYILPDKQKKIADPLDITRVANNINHTLKSNSHKVSISVDDKGTYGQIILSSSDTPIKHLLCLDSYSKTMEEMQGASTNIEYYSIYNALLYLNQSLGQPFAWMNNRPVWRHIYNHDKSGLLISLNILEAQANCFDMKRIGSKIDDKFIVPELNKIFNTSIRTARSFVDVKPWRDYSGFDSNKILGADEESAVYSALIYDPSSSAWGSRKKIKHIDTFCLVKAGNFLRFAIYEQLKASPKDEEDWMRSPQIIFPDEVDTLADFEEVQAPTPPPETETETETEPEPEEIAPENKKGQKNKKNKKDKPEVLHENEAEITETPQPAPQAEEKAELSPEEALELYIKSLQEFEH